MIAITGCHSKNGSAETSKAETGASQQIITFADFKKIKGVDNVQDVPFELFSKLDSVQFFVSPHQDAHRLKVAYNKFDNYYGFEEFDDFYSIHYSINNNISNSIEAFVLKSEFTPASQLTLQGIDLYEIRSSRLKGSEDLKNKSFNKYGTITEVSEQEFKTASKGRMDEVLVKNPLIKLKDGNWIYTGNAKETVIAQHENVSTEDGQLSNEYIGRSPSLNLEIFKENSVEVSDTYYTFYNVKSTEDFVLFTGGFPHILPDKNRISYIGSNDDVGSNFEISKYTGQGSGQESLFYVNFTTFKIADETKAFWANDETFYAEVYPANSAPSKGKKQKTAYIKITLKPNLL